MIEGAWAALYIFLLAAFTGYEVIGRVPVILHTPLMSGSNFIHGIRVPVRILYGMNRLSLKSFLKLLLMTLTRLIINLAYTSELVYSFWYQYFSFDSLLRLGKFLLLHFFLIFNFTTLTTC